MRGAIQRPANANRDAAYIAVSDRALPPAVIRIQTKFLA